MLDVGGKQKITVYKSVYSTQIPGARDDKLFVYENISSLEGIMWAFYCLSTLSLRQPVACRSARLVVLALTHN